MFIFVKQRSDSFFPFRIPQRPMIPASHADEPHKADLFADAIDVMRVSNISTIRGRKGHRDRRRAWHAVAGLSSPMHAIADETSEPKAAATPANRQHSVHRESQTP